jgi:hypothetical protein
VFITFCDSGSQGRCSIKKKKILIQTQVKRGAVEIAENWESYHKHEAVIEDFAPSVCSSCVIYSSTDGNLAGN